MKSLRTAGMIALAAITSAALGCMAPTTPAQRLAEAASDMNTATRFGRMDVALELVGAKARDEFARQHAAWGVGVRVVDVELHGMNLVGDDNADVFLSVSWQRSDEAQMRLTHVSQRWKDDRGWRLEREERKAGDFGLLGEKTVVLEPARSTARFPTRVIHEQ
jgi:hypothetical protein